MQRIANPCTSVRFRLAPPALMRAVSIMDPQVVAAMARWPDVPAVYGWLSLTEAGQWRLHPAGNALQQPDSPGEPITSPQILAFLDRNYASDDDGCWYFQNGPQRVYVRLDATPYILRTTTDTANGRLRLRTHTGLDVRDITALYLDAQGRLYMATDRGPGLVAGRDLPAVFDALEGADGTDAAELIAEFIETGRGVQLRSQSMSGFPARAVPLSTCTPESLQETLGFRRCPSAPPSSEAPAGEEGPASR